MTKRIMKKLAFLLSIVMVVSLFTNLDFAVFAGEKVDITANNYETDEAGEYCYSVRSGDAYGTINVPGEHYHLIVENAAVTADTVILESGASLEILGDGALNFSGSGSGIQAADGALMMLQSKEKKPSVIDGLFDIFHNEETGVDEEVNIYENPGEPEWEWMTFRYAVSESGEGKWYVLPGDGPEPGTLTLHYDNQDGGYVTWGGDTIESDRSYSFFADNSTEEQPLFKEINLTFHTPADIENTQILVRVNGKDFYDNGTACDINDELFGDTNTYFSTDESGNVTFTYSPVRDDAVDIEVIWLRPGGPQFNDNEYSVMYDQNGEAKVSVNGELIGDCETKTFAVGDVLNFTLTPPDFRQGETPIVEIVVHDGDESTGTPETVWRSDFEDSNPQKITLVNNTFSFTPASEKGFEVFISWSEYDAFGGNDEYPVVVEIDCTGEGTIGIAGISEENKFVWNNFTKVRVAKDTDSLTLTWEENAAPQEIRVEGGNVNAEDGWLILGENDFNNNSCSIPLTQTEEDGSKKGFYYVQVQYDGGGAEENNQYNFERLQDELNGTYFAFGDINEDRTADINDLKYGVMRTLYDGFRVNEGRYQREGAALGLIEDFNKDNPTNLNANMNRLLSFASVETTPIEGDTISATDKSGVSHTFEAYKVTITIRELYENRTDLKNFPGESEEATSLGEQPIVLTTKAYLINMTDSDEQVIIKVKDTYFVRDAYSDRSGSENNVDDLEDFEGLNARALILVADYDTKEDIVVFGNYATMNETLSDETADRFFASGFGTGDGVKYLGDKFVVMKPGFLGVTINGSGETKTPLAWSVESSLSIAETGVNSGNDTETDVYFGFDSVEIAPITSGKVEGLGVISIGDVEVLDGIPENAVQVVETAPGSGKYTVQFKSDYYDTVRIKVTYNTDDGTESGIMTLNRVGIMIQGGMTAGDSGNVNIFHGHNQGETLDNNVYDAYKAANSDKRHGDYKYAYYATYYYPTDSNATSADTSLFVTYTYADGSVERKLLQSYHFTAATAENVAMSDYILYMGDGSNAPVKVEAIAIPNVNADGTINGAKLGAGKGVVGTFDIESE